MMFTIFYRIKILLQSVRKALVYGSILDIDGTLFKE